MAHPNRKRLLLYANDPILFAQHLGLVGFGVGNPNGGISMEITFVTTT